MWPIVSLFALVLSLLPTVFGVDHPGVDQGLHKITLSSRKSTAAARSTTSVRRRALGPANVPLTDFFLGTDLQWFGNITVGTPPQVISVVFDTGSSSLEFTSTLCNSCTQPMKFNSTASSSFVDGGETTSLTFATGVGVDPAVGDDYTLYLRSGTDTVSVGGLDAGPTDLWLVTDQTPKFNIDPFSGIQGMSAQAQGFFGNLVSQGLPSLFSLYLTPQAVGNAELTIGGIDNTKFTGDLTYVPLEPDWGPVWTLRSTGITVNGKTAPTLNVQRDIIFDSGTSNVLFSTATAEAIYAMISKDIKPYTPEPGTYGIACSSISTLPAVISITFKSQSGSPFDLTIPSSELNVGPFKSDPSTCQTLINAYEGLNILGGSLLKHYYSVWDIGEQRIGFVAVGGEGNSTTSANGGAGGARANGGARTTTTHLTSTFALILPCIFLIAMSGLRS